MTALARGPFWWHQICALSNDVAQHKAVLAIMGLTGIVSAVRILSIGPVYHLSRFCPQSKRATGSP
jgi:hypothetical protein